LARVDTFTCSTCLEDFPANHPRIDSWAAYGADDDPPSEPEGIYCSLTCAVAGLEIVGPTPT
jgi:hypothetical protein